eukprot:TRINITY_DN2274_c0_g2_i1.p1 TRINITY_DN2274_c0_g2~~TRINITY_DN2274_c0_g2_i1.p1  ORF type:complete len:641 (-),score=182.20 TRINITY_DN2274_c0_g2_i1:982-2868(-)
MNDSKSKKVPQNPTIISFFNSTSIKPELNPDEETKLELNPPKSNKKEERLLTAMSPIIEEENTKTEQIIEGNWFEQQNKETLPEETFFYEPKPLTDSEQMSIVKNIFERKEIKEIKDLLYEFKLKTKKLSKQKQNFLKNKKLYKVNDDLTYFKFLQFYENIRPPFWGTNTINTTYVTPVNPLFQEPHIDYDNDSGVDYIPTNLGGEADVDGIGSESEKEMVDGQFIVADDYLSEEEADGENINLSEKTTSKKIPVVSRMPICVVPSIYGNSASERIENLVEQYPELYEEPEELPFKHIQNNRTNEPNRKEFIDEFKNYQVNAPKWGKLAISLIHLPLLLTQGYNPLKAVKPEEFFQKQTKAQLNRMATASKNVTQNESEKNVKLEQNITKEVVSIQDRKEEVSKKEKNVITVEDLLAYEVDLLIEWVHGKEGSKTNMIKGLCSFLENPPRGTKLPPKKKRRIPVISQSALKNIFNDHVKKIGKEFYCDETILKKGNREELIHLIPEKAIKRKKILSPKAVADRRKRKLLEMGNVPIMQSQSPSPSTSPIDSSSVESLTFSSIEPHVLKTEEEDFKRVPQLETDESQSLLLQSQSQNIYDLSDSQLYDTQTNSENSSQEPQIFMMSQAF